MNKKMTWAQIKATLADSTLADQIRFAELAKCEDIPEDAKAQAALEKAAADAKSGLKLTYGSQNDAGRVYLGGPSHAVGVGEKPGMARGSYTEVRTLDAEIAFLTAARDALRQAGFHTSPSENPGVGINQARALGFKVGVGKDVDPSKVYGG